jgi:hypothetical protein
VPQEALPQQTPSTQLPVAQSLANAQAFPTTLRQAPEPSQVESPEHPSSVAFLSGEHVPTLPVCAQLSQVPSQARSQQTPSTQKPLAHCAPTVHVTLGGGISTPPSAAGGFAVASGAPASALLVPVSGVLPASGALAASGFALEGSETITPPPSASIAPPAGPHAASNPAPKTIEAIAPQS